MNNESSGCYVIDSDYRVVNMNETAHKLYPQLKIGAKCHRCLMGIDVPCGPCPVAAGRKGPTTYTDPIRNISEIVDAVEIEVPEHGLCHALIFSTVENEAKFAASLPTNADELKALALIKALTVDYYDVLSLDLTSSSMILYRLNGKPLSADSGYNGEISYTEGLERYISKYVVPEDQAEMREKCAPDYIRGALATVESFTLHYRVMLKGELHHFYRRIARVGDAASFTQVVIGIGNEDEGARLMQQQIALQDTLRKVELNAATGLLTREAFLIHGSQLLARCAEDVFDFSILRIDNLEAIKRQYGPLARSKVLQMVGEQLKTYEQEKMCIAYLGDGTYGSLSLHMSPEERKASIAEFEAVVAKNSRIQNIVFRWSVYPNVDRTVPIEKTYEKFNYVLTAVRSNIHQSYAEFNQEMFEQMDWDRTVESNFLNALKNEEFEVWFQPQYSVRTQKIVGAEALVRWRAKNNELIPPSRFIPVLENTGLINLLDEEVFRQVCRMQQHLTAIGLPRIPISVNLSRASIFTKDIAGVYADIADEHGIEHEMIPVEITESAAVRAAMIREFAASLIAKGFVLHMDDFGAGYSSLASLQVIPFTDIKLDKSLVDFIGKQSGESLLKHTIAFAKESGMSVIAEGVETLEQFMFLKVAGCDTIQGYYFSKPVEKDVLISMLQAQ